MRDFTFKPEDKLRARAWAATAVDDAMAKARLLGIDEGLVAEEMIVHCVAKVLDIDPDDARERMRQQFVRSMREARDLLEADAAGRA